MPRLPFSMPLPVGLPVIDANGVKCVVMESSAQWAAVAYAPSASKGRYVRKIWDWRIRQFHDLSLTVDISKTLGFRWFVYAMLGVCGEHPDACQEWVAPMEDLALDCLLDAPSDAAVLRLATISGEAWVAIRAKQAAKRAAEEAATESTPHHATCLCNKCGSRRWFTTKRETCN